MCVTYTISWFFIRYLLFQSNRILVSRPPTPVLSYLDSLSLQVYAAYA